MTEEIAGIVRGPFLLLVPKIPTDKAQNLLRDRLYMDLPDSSDGGVLTRA